MSTGSYKQAVLLEIESQIIPALAQCLMMLLLLLPALLHSGSYSYLHFHLFLLPWSLQQPFAGSCQGFMFMLLAVLAFVVLILYCSLFFVTLVFGTLVLHLTPSWLSTKPFASFSHERYTKSLCY
jgi:hypothetical protein